MRGIYYGLCLFFTLVIFGASFVEYGFLEKYQFNGAVIFGVDAQGEIVSEKKVFTMKDWRETLVKTNQDGSTASLRIEFLTSEPFTISHDYDGLYVIQWFCIVLMASFSTALYFKSQSENEDYEVIV